MNLKWHHKVLFITFAIVAIGLIVGVWKETRLKANAPVQLYSGTSLPQSRPFPAFNLIDAKNRHVNQSIFNNRWSLVFFGYTECPELCPRTLSLMAEIKQIIGLQSPFEMYIISINPDQDSPEQLNTFLSQPLYQKGLLKGLTGEREVIKDLASTIGLYVQEDVPDIGHIEHSGTLLVINPQGELSALITKPTDPFLIAKDLQKLVSHEQHKKVG